MAKLLLEIGTEELPVSALDVIYSDLTEKTRKKFAEEHIAFDNIIVEATPRRIALFVEGLPVKQPDYELEISGPSRAKCYDENGNATQVLNGFLKSKNAAEKDIEIRETPKGEFVFIKKKEKGNLVSAVLPEVIRGIILSLSFPKFMRWEETNFKFPRPIRWIVALLDAKKISIELAGIKSSNQSFGHRFLAPKSFAIAKADWKSYLAVLKKNHVHLLISDRERLLREQLEKKYGQTKIDEELLHINAQLVEEPFFLQGDFSKEYLELPAEVLASSMKKNQKVFACYDPKGNMQNKFIAVLNGKRNGLLKVQADYENVLDSRLKDARYFYNLDTKEPFENKKARLAKVVYLGKLGSMLDKTERLEKLSGFFAEISGNANLAKDLARVSALSKIDLITHLVYEMPDLQGIVGGEYARVSGCDANVSSAIATQYLPKSLTESYADAKKQITLLGALFGALDRFDLLVGAFGTGIEPTGSQDPFALRRAGGVLVKLIRAYGIDFPVEQILEKNIDLYGDKLSKKENLKERLSKFLQERVAYESGAKTESRAFEILQAVLRTSSENLADIFKRFDAVLAIDDKMLSRAAKIVQRTANMLKGYKGEIPGIKPELLKEPQEKKLFETLQAKSPAIIQAIEKGEYESATRLYGDSLLDAVNEFFDGVLVNAEDLNVRANRIALVAAANQLYTSKIADISLIS